jgi:hypothetical protein
MKRRLLNSDELFASSQYGWEEMKFLLDANLPVVIKKRHIVLRLGVAASLTGLLLISSLIIHDNNFRIAARKNHFPGSTDTKVINTSQKENYVVQTVQKFNEPLFQQAASKNIALVQLIETKINTTLLRKEGTKDLERIDYADLKAKDTFSTDNLISKSGHNIICPLDTEIVHMLVSGKKSNEIRYKNKLQFSAGAAVNATINQHQSLQPFPAAEVLYEVSTNFYISLGLAASSAVSTSSQGISKTVYLNDTANNIQFYNQVTNYTHLYYADLPLLAGLKIGKRFSVEGGFQASFLLKTKGIKSIDKYDFQMRLANLPQNTFMGIAGAAPENNYNVNVMKMDYRFVTGLRYSIHKIAVDLTYQYAFQPAFKGKQVNADKNQLVTLKVLYKLK